MTTGAEARAPAQRIYDTIQEQEDLLGAPEFLGRGSVGTFDARTGQFSGLRSANQCRPAAPKPECNTIAPTLDVFGVRAVLVFHFRHVILDGQVMLTVGRRVRPVAKGRRRVMVDIGRASNATWSITVRQGNFISAEIADKVRIHRPHVLGAGVFTLKAVPVAIVYTPPQPADPTRFNSTLYTDTTTIGTRLSTSFSTEQGVRHPARTTFETTEQIQAGLRTASSGMRGSDNPYVKAAGAALGAMGDALGRADKTEEEVRSTIAGGALELQTTKTFGCGPTERGGPGVSDGFIFLENARLVWLYANGRMSVALLGARAMGCKYASTLSKALATLRRERPRTGRDICLNPPTQVAPSREHADAAAVAGHLCHTGLDIPTIQALLDLDPFVAGGPQARLPGERFEPAATPELFADNLDIPVAVRDSVTTEDTHVVTRSKITTTDTSKSFLSFVGIGPTETERIVGTVASSSATTFRTNTNVTTSALIQGPPPGSDRFLVFFDRLFGTFVFQTLLP